MGEFFGCGSCGNRIFVQVGDGSHGHVPPSVQSWMFFWFSFSGPTRPNCPTRHLPCITIVANWGLSNPQFTKENRIPFNPTSFLVATPQTNQQSLLLRGSNSHCSVLSLANSVNLAKKSKAPLTDSYQRCKYEKQPPPKKMFATVLEDTFFETWGPKKCNMFAYSNYLLYRDWKFGTWHTHLRFGWHHQICCAFVPVWYCPA